MGRHMPRVATIGALPESDVLPFLLEYAKNDSRVPLPTTQPYKDDELRRRCARVAPLLTTPFGLADADDAFNHLRLIESHFFSLPAMEVAQPHCAVLEPREHECMYCEDVPLHTREDKSFGMKGGELRVLTETSVLRGYAYSRHCPRCKRVYFHDRVAHPPTEAERAAGQTDLVERCAEPRPLHSLTSPSTPTSPHSTAA